MIEGDRISPGVRVKISGRLGDMAQKADDIRNYLLDTYPAEQCNQLLREDVVKLCGELIAIATICDIANDRMNNG